MKENDVYSELAEKLGAPVSKRFLAIVNEMLTPEEARICIELMTPATCPELSKKLNIDEKSLSKTLGSLVDRGILTRGKTQYGFHKNLVGFHHDYADAGVFKGPHAVSQKIKDLWEDFFRNEWADIMMKEFSEMQEASGTSMGLHVTPAIGALELSPNIRPEDILPEENWKLQIENAKRRIVAPCGCRVLWGHCDCPLMTCFACFDNDRGDYYIDQPGRLLKELTLEETMDLVREAEKSGLVHWGVCYCCVHACEMHFPVARAKRFDLIWPSRYRAVVDEELCTGCQDCVEICPYEAIDMKKGKDSKKLKASINAENCKGCGLCIIGCEQRALQFEIARPPEYIKKLASPELPEDFWGFYHLK